MHCYGCAYRCSRVVIMLIHSQYKCILRSQFGEFRSYIPHIQMFHGENVWICLFVLIVRASLCCRRKTKNQCRSHATNFLLAFQWLIWATTSTSQLWKMLFFFPSEQKIVSVEFVTNYRKSVRNNFSGRHVRSKVI